MSRLDEKRFNALGSEWIARFDFNAQCALEEETGKGFFELLEPMMVQLDAEDAEDPEKVMAALRKMRMSDIRRVLFHALLGQHPSLTIEGTGDIIGDIGVMPAMEIVVWALMRAMPSDPAQGDPDDPELDTGVASSAQNPPKANRKARRTAAARAG